MESKLYEECHEGGGFMAQQAMLKQDETVRTQIPTMKPLEWAVLRGIHGLHAAENEKARFAALLGKRHDKWKKSHHKELPRCESNSGFFFIF